jgi:hypothetical protein
VPYITKKVPTTTIETGAVQIPGTGRTIVGAYNPPHNYFQKSELEKILGMSTKIIVAGELNAKSGLKAVLHQGNNWQHVARNIFWQ